MAKKAKVRLKKAKSKPKAPPQPRLIGKVEVRTIAHIRFDADGNPRKKEF